MTRCIAIALLALALHGCLTPGEYTPTLRYPLEPAPALEPAATGPAILGMRSLDAALPYDRQMTVFKGEGAPLEVKRHAEWAERPETVVTRALLDALASSGRFADVGDAAFMRPPDYLLTGELRLFRENRADGAPEAEIEVRLELRHALKPGAPWAATLRHTEPLAEDTPGGLATAMTRAVKALTEEAAGKIVALDLEKGQE